MLMTFWGVSAGSLGLGFDGEGVFQKSFLGGNLLALLLEVFDVNLDGLPCHRYCLIDGLPEGDAAGKRRHSDGIPAFRLSPEEDTVIQASRRIAPLLMIYITRCGIKGIRAGDALLLASHTGNIILRIIRVQALLSEW